ncbi:MAG TPA: hypothetical protein DCM05_01535 [Elusimicrobia bacterium]|nr:hypothetical protein [Elusimicrobiota bacterium]
MTTPYGIIGDGRAATHFARYLSLAKIPHRQWSRKKSVETPERALRGCRTLLVLIKDSAIEPFLRAHPSLAAQRPVQFSGSLATPLAAGAHPLAAFGSRPFTLSEYERIHFVSEEGGPSFGELFPRLKNPSSALAKELKPYYHALCVLSGNFSTLLWQKLFKESARTLGLPRSAVAAYLDCVCQNIGHDPDAALSGPLSRGDDETLRRGLAALSGDPMKSVYEAFARCPRL